MHSLRPRQTLCLILGSLSSFTLGALLLSGCYSTELPTNPSGYANTEDETNRNAAYVGSAACTLCHSVPAAQQAQHTHAHILTAIQGTAPVFPTALNAGVPNPPAGFSWSDIAYVIGGYAKRALFLDQDGYLLTRGASGVDTQWNLAFAPSGETAKFVALVVEAVAPVPFDFETLRHLATGAKPIGASGAHQDGRPGIEGTWAEAGVQCEACHGPGSGHYIGRGPGAQIFKNRIFVDVTGAKTCVVCHTQPYGDDSGEIAARDGYIAPLTEAAQLKASGAHAKFQCGYCHEPHRSALYDTAGAIVNDCTNCHPNQTMAGHQGKVFKRGSYTETVTCRSCHMPFAVRNGSSASAAEVGPEGRLGDTRAHIFRIDPDAGNYAGMFTDDGLAVRRDTDGHAALTVDFVCLRCHGGTGVFQLEVESAAAAAKTIHSLP